MNADVRPLVAPGRERPPPARGRPVAEAEAAARLLGPCNLRPVERLALGVRLRRPHATPRRGRLDPRRNSRPVRPETPCELDALAAAAERTGLHPNLARDSGGHRQCR